MRIFSRYAETSHPLSIKEVDPMNEYKIRNSDATEVLNSLHHEGVIKSYSVEVNDTTSSSESSTLSLHQYLYKVPDVLLFLKFMGVVPYDSNDVWYRKIFFWSWSWLIKFFFFCLFGMSIYFATANSTDISNPTNQACIILLYVILCMQIFSLFPSIRHFNHRLQQKVKIIEIPHFVDSIPSCLVFFTVASIVGIISPLYDMAAFTASLGFGELFHGLILLFSQFAFAAYMSVAILLMLVDARVSKDICVNLLTCAKNGTLTLKQFNSARDEITRRVDESFLVNFIVEVVVVLLGDNGQWDFAELLYLCFYVG